MKETIITNLRLAFENSTIGIPDDQVLIDELEAYEYEILPSGRLSYGAPEGKHDDTVIALALDKLKEHGAKHGLGKNLQE